MSTATPGCIADRVADDSVLEAVFEVSNALGVTSSATLRGWAGSYTLAVERVEVLLGAVDDCEWRERARVFAERGDTVEVVHRGRHLLTLGSCTPSPAVQRVTGLPTMAIGRWPRAARIVLARRTPRTLRERLSA